MFTTGTHFADESRTYVQMSLTSAEFSTKVLSGGYIGSDGQNLKIWSGSVLKVVAFNQALSTMEVEAVAQLSAIGDICTLAFDVQPPPPPEPPQPPPQPPPRPPPLPPPAPPPNPPPVAPDLSGSLRAQPLLRLLRPDFLPR